MKINTLEDVDNLIRSQIQESSVIEYKSSEAIKHKEEISKDVSSMANAGGGVIIYGVAEFDDKSKKHLPERRDPVTTHDREYLDQVINSSIRPKVNARIEAISDPDGGFIFVVEILQGETAHQASDHRYYRRYNFQRLPMEDHEVKDVMNRQKHPKVTLKFKISGSSLRPFLLNEGRIMANNVRCMYWIPKHFLRSDVTRVPIVAKQETGWEFDHYLFDYHSSHVIHSGLPLMLKPHSLALNIVGFLQLHEYDKKSIENPNSPVIKWKVFADNAEPSEGKTRLSECFTGITIP